MLFGPEKDLDRFPSREAPRRQSGNRGRIVVILGGLQAMLAASHMPHVRDGRVRRLKEQGVIVTADGFVKRSEFLGGEVLIILVAKLSYDKARDCS